MALLSIIEFFDNSGEIIVARIPPEGSGEFKLGSQLVVQESQHAIFFRDGQALDGFDAGRHTLSTQNLPLLGRIIGAPFGGTSPFRSYVYFVSSKTFVSLGWGTQAPVLFRDKDFRMISLRAHGTFSIRITKPRIFVNTLVGTRGIETTHGLHEFFRSAIVSRLNEALSTVMESILDLPKEYNNLALKTKEMVSLDFEQYGVQLVDLLIQAITPPKEVQEMMNRATGVAAQDVEKYQAISAADALQDAAKNPSGLAGEGVGAGLGLAMGLGMAQQFGKDAAPNPSVQGERGGGESLSPEELKEKLQKLKGLKDEGLISDADFEEQKRRLLSML
ncbi:MAG: virion core protein (lumpy skin disease virus) [Roseibacillus sp.]|nr:virion core protein (lumpy skin disease virus) [Roseibacillus sp.]